MKNLFIALKDRHKNKNKIKSRKNKTVSEVYYSPAGDLSKGALLAGLILRTLVVYFGIFGIGLFICESAGMNTCDWWGAELVTPARMALISLPPALFCGIASLNVICEAASPVVYGGLYALFVTLFCPGNVISFTVGSALRAYNCMLYTISDNGYLKASELMANDGFDYSEIGLENDPYLFGGAFLVATLLGVFLYFTVQKKVRLLPLAVGMTAIIVPILTYNVAKGNIGFGFMIAFICGVVAMKIYDRYYGGTMEKKAERKKRLIEKKKERAKKRLKNKKEKQKLRLEAERMLDAALDADMGMKRSKLAKRAVYKARREEKKAERKALKKVPGEKKTPKVKKDRRETRKISMAGGYTGFGVALIVLIAMWIPMAAVKGEFRIIEPLNEKVMLIRDYVTEKLSGNYVDLNDDYIYEDFPLYPTTLTFDPVNFRKERMFQVETTSKEHNVYLKSRAMRDFDTDTGTWSTADFSEVVNFRRDYGTDFTPDMIKTAFYNAVYPSSTELEGTKNYKNFTGFGFTVQQVNIVRRSGYSKLMFVPEYMDTNIGILKYGTDEKTDDSYSCFFDGIYSSGDLARTGAGFGTVSFITDLSRNDVVFENIDMSLEYLRRAREVILENCDKELSEDEISALVYDFEKTLSDDGITYTGTSLVDRYFYGMTEEESYSLLDYFDYEKVYSEYAKGSYTEKSNSNTVKTAAEKILTDARERLGKKELSDAELTMAVVDCFRSGEYTLTDTPDKAKYDGKKTVLDAFLTDVKEGYCTHFATAAAMILREFGLPTRYAEGYVATDFNIAIGTKTADFRSFIDDDDAHAWIEVYFDGMGWVQFEVCPGKLSDDMYSPSNATVVTDPERDKPSGDADDPFMREDDGGHHESGDKFETDMEPDKFESELKWFIKGVVILAVIALVLVGGYFLIRHLSKKAQDAIGERYRIIDRCRNPETFKNEQNDLHWLQRKLNDIILDIFALIGLSPEVGETPEEYGERLHEKCPEFSSVDVRKVINAIEKEEFGHGLDESEMTLCADYADEMITSVYNSLGLFTKIRLRYLKRKI